MSISNLLDTPENVKPSNPLAGAVAPSAKVIPFKPVAEDSDADFIAATGGLSAPMSAARPEDVTPQEFIEATHGPYASLAYLATVHKDETGKGTGWGGYRADLSRLDPEAEAYYARGIVRSDTIDKPHSDANWSAATLLVIDDVGEARKSVSGSNTIEHVRAVLGQPSYTIQSSAQSFQVGYIFDAAVTDAAWMDTLRRAINLKFFDGVEPGGEQRVQWMRLPMGRNLKPERNKFPVRLTEWAPSRKYKPGDLKTKLADVWEAAAVNARGIKENGFPGPRTEAEARAYLKSNATYRGLEELGLLDYVKGDGFVRLKNCPWHGEHTGGEDTSVYNPETKGFDCKHGHCSDRHGGDVAEWVKAEITETKGAEAWAAVVAETIPFDKVTTANDDYAAPSKTEAEAAERRQAAEIETQKPNRRQWERIGTAPVEPEFERERIADRLVIGEVSQLSAQPSAGKSMRVVNLVAALITERHELAGEREPFERTGDIYIVSNEDTPQDFKKRRNAWLIEHKLSEADVKHEVYINPVPDFTAVRCSGKGMPAEITPDMRGIAEDIRELRAAGRKVSVLILDTQTTVLAVDESDNNAMGNAYRALGAWAQANRIALLILHHTTKEAGKTGAIGMTASRGAGAAMASARHGVQLATLTESEARHLPEDEAARWVKEENTKGNHVEPGKHTKWFYKRSVSLPTKRREHEGGGMGRSESVGVLVYMANGPAVGADVSDQSLLTNALLAVWQADKKGAPLFTAVKGNSPRRACVAVGHVVAPTVRNAGARNEVGLTFLAELARQDLATREVIAADGRKAVEVWLPTSKGAELAAERSGSVFDTPGGGVPPAETAPSDVVVPPKPRQRARRASETAGGGADLLAWLGETA